MKGILVIYKEKGYTSQDTVSKLRGILKYKKIGHTGTLDPNAVGVLPVCIGRYTKLCDYIMDKNKVYIGEVILGIKTDTLDITGNVLEKRDVGEISREKIEEVLKTFLGKSIQKTPMYSARKVQGKKLYEYARKGEVIETPLREIFISEIKLEEYNKNRFKIKVKCSKGTYIRMLVADIGEKLGTVSTMGDLERIEVGKFSIKDSITLEEVEKNKDKICNYLKDISEVIDVNNGIIKEKAFYKAINGNELDFYNDIKMIGDNKDNNLQYYLIKTKEGKEIGLYSLCGNSMKLEVYLYE